MPAPADPRIAALVDGVRQRHVPDLRSGIFDVIAEPAARGVTLRGQSTHPEAVDELLDELADLGIAALDEVVRLPDQTVGETRHALVRSAVAPVYAEPRLPAPQISQLVLGMRVEMLSRSDSWIRIRGEDGYLGWVYDGYLQQGPEDWAHAWERGTHGESVVSLGAELVDPDGRVIARLPWGARITRHSGAFQLPDGRSGTIVNGDVVDVDRLADWFPARGESVARTARRWFGAPYLWGGVTLNGVDCSGFTQAVMWMHGVALPRDSDLQSRTMPGLQVELDHSALRAGDLLYFAEPDERVTHVAISLGGSTFIHSSLGNGGVAINDLAGDLPLERKLADMFVSARRALPD